MSRLTWVRHQEIRHDFGYGIFTLYDPTFQTVHLSSLFSRVIPMTSLNPGWTCVQPVWAVPLSLAATDGIADCFLFLRVLRCFTSPGLPPATMNSSRAAGVLPPAGFPIRTSTDQNLVSGSPWLIAATHVLRRLLEPRHPPHALSSLVTLDSSLPSSRSDDALSRPRSRSFGDTDPTTYDFAVRCISTLRIRLSESSFFDARLRDAGNPRNPV